MNPKRVLQRSMAILGLCAVAVCTAFAQTGTSPVASGVDPGYQALSSGNVYVDPSLNNVDINALQQASMQSQGNPHTYVKIDLLATLPNGHGTRGQYTTELHDALNLGRNGLLVVVLNGKGRGISIATDGLGKDAKTALAKQYAPAIVTNSTAGTAALAQAIAHEVNAKDYQSSIGLWVVFIFVAGGVICLIVVASRRKKQQLAVMRGPIDALRDNVLSGIEYLDGYIDVLPKNNPDSDAVRTYRQSASAKYDQAIKILDRATETSDLSRAQMLLDRAQTDVGQARTYLDRATGGTANIPGDDAMRPPPLPSSEAEVQAIPQAQRGVSFFSSQPAPLGSLVPVTITINGESRQVLATPEEADELRQGRMPNVRAFNVNGRSVPWYEYDRYDPYDDYWRYQNSGWNTFAAGWIGAELLSSLYAPAYAMPYAFATDNAYYQGYNDAQNVQSNGGFFGGNDGGGGGFFGNNSDNSGGSGFFGGNDNGGGSNNTTDDSGGADFFSDTVGFDSSDSGGFDSGGSDFGGDSGGGDSGGSDF